jgi:hypothetical protein
VGPVESLYAATHSGLKKASIQRSVRNQCPTQNGNNLKSWSPRFNPIWPPTVLLLSHLTTQSSAPSHNFGDEGVCGRRERLWAKSPTRTEVGCRRTARRNGGWRGSAQCRPTDGVRRKNARELHTSAHKFLTRSKGERRKLLKNWRVMVGAGRFELPTPCAQGSFRPPSKMPYFQLLTFQADGGTPLQVVAPCGTRRLSPATFLSTACNQRCHEAGDRSQCRRRRRRQGRSPGTPASGTMAMLFLSRNSNAAITHRGFGILNVLRITVALRVAPPRFRAPSATPRP